VGSSLYQLKTPKVMIDGGSDNSLDTAVDDYGQVAAYTQHLNHVCDPANLRRLDALISASLPIEKQEDEKQQLHKLSYYCESQVMQRVVSEIENQVELHGLAVGVVQSVDPFDQRGLIDVLPRGVNKAFALDWWSQHRGIARDQIVFAGDSGNDYAALASGYRGIVVGNASQELRDRLGSRADAKGAIDADKLYFAKQHYTCGVVEGARYHGILPAKEKL
jgi:hydroxymethylpyrimidine pyrophosphatase-like HAD family hydrolase